MTDPIPQLNTALDGHYVVEGELGRGGMATVYRARDLRHGREVAIKVLHPELAISIGSDRFVREIEIAARLTHPHILPVFDSGSADGILYYVMPLVEGKSLRARIERGKLPVAELVRITDQVASALTYAHEHGVVHRDIKPENILLTGDQAIVADFGIARAVEAAGGERLTGTGLAVGTPAYMSPEQASGTGAVDGRADIYALGCLVYEMASGEPPFQGATPQALILHHLSDPTPSLRRTDPSIPLFVERAVERAMAKDPDSRFGSASEFAAALTTATVVSRVTRRRRRRQLLVGSAIAVGAALLLWLGSLSTASTVHALAVLPLTDLSNDTSQAWFANGVHEALIGELASTGITVISRSSVMRYRESDLPASEIARELGVDALVEGSVFRTGDSVEIRARLIDPATATATWSGSFDGNLPNVTALYRGLTRAVAGEIRYTVSPDAEARLAETAVVDADLYETYLRGMHHLNKLTPEDIDLALGYFNTAIERNPASALAYAGLAMAYVTLGHGPGSPADAWVRARAAAERAVRLDPGLADGWAALADVRTYADYDWEGADSAFQRASALNPSLAMNHFHRAWYLALFGRMDEAVAEHELARDLDPFAPFGTAFLGSMYAKQGRSEEAIAEGRRAIAMQTDAPTSTLAMTGILALAGRHDEAIESAKELAAISPMFRVVLAHTYARTGRTEQARALLAELETQPTVAFTTLYLGMTHIELGDVDEAVRWLSMEPAHAWLPWVVVGLNRREEYRSHPGFERLAARLNLTGVLGWEGVW